MKYILIFDPYVSGSYIISKILANHIKVILVFSSPDYYQHTMKLLNRPDVELYIINKNTEYIANLIKDKYANDIIGVLCCEEYTVKEYDIFMHYFRPLKGNPINSSAARQDKYEMQSALIAKNLPSIQQIKINLLDNERDINSVISTLKNFPVVIKPINSGGSQNVKKCFDAKEIYSFVKLVSKNDPSCTTYTIQEFQNGTEYPVDIYRDENENIVSYVSRYYKETINGRFIYRYIDNHLDSNLKTSLLEYATQVLDAVELFNGYAHIEIIKSEDGFRLIEVNPRFSGFNGQLLEMQAHAYGVNPIEVLLRYFSNLPLLKLKQEKYSRLCIINEWNSEVARKINQNSFDKLPSFISYLQILAEGTRFRNDYSLTSTVGYIILAHENDAQIEEDYAIINSLEKSGKIFC